MIHDFGGECEKEDFFFFFLAFVFVFVLSGLRRELNPTPLKKPEPKTTKFPSFLLSFPPCLFKCFGNSLWEKEKEKEKEKQT